MSQSIVIAGSCRTPIGTGPRNGLFNDVLAADLLVACFLETLKRASLDVRHIHEVIVGQVAQLSDALNIARVSALKAGFPESITAHSVQRNCGSGLQALVSAAQMIKAGDAEVVLAGGTESMSNIPLLLRGMRNGVWYYPGRGMPLPHLIDALDEGLFDPVTRELMGKTAENVAEKYRISREDQDEFAVRSHQNAFRAVRSGKFRSQIVSVKTNKQMVSQDEGINPALNRQILAMHPTLFKEHGTVTKGNSCQISDGASSFVVMTLERAQSMGMVAEAEVAGYAFAACNPSYMGMGPAYAIPLALKRVGLKLEDIDLFEINEAFASQVLACQRQLGIPMEKLNLYGGAIAMGHPVGATGAILVTKAIAMLKDMQKEYAVVSLCIGGGQGGAVIIRNLLS